MKVELKYNPCNDRWHGDRLYFKEACDTSWMIINGDEEELGRLERTRCGQFMHWCLLLWDDCYLSPGCLDEVRAFQKKLYSLKTSNKSEVKKSNQ